MSAAQSSFGWTRRVLTTVPFSIDISFDDVSMCSGCEVHSGFNSAWDAVSTDLLAKLKVLRAAYPTYSITFTGHSLGAAIATIGCATYVHASPTLNRLFDLFIC